MNVETAEKSIAISELQAKVDAIPYWYHRVELPGNIVTPGWAPLDASKYWIPDDLTARSVLDVGTWDGYWAFEAMKRNATTVHAIEDFSDTCGNITNASRLGKFETFDLCLKSLAHENSSRVSRYDCSVYDVTGMYSDIFCFGVLYHLKHPLLALERLRSCCYDTIHIETAILDNTQSSHGNYGYSSEASCFEFYDKDQYGCNDSNWWVGTLKAWELLVKGAGFKNIESWKLTEHPQNLSEARGFIRATV